MTTHDRTELEGVILPYLQSVTGGWYQNFTMMKVFFDEECLLHDPPYEILSGKFQSYYETPKRLLQIRQALEENPTFQIENADRSIDTREHVLRVHSDDYVYYLENAFRLCVEDGGDPKVQKHPSTVEGDPRSLAPGPTVPRDLPQSQVHPSLHHRPPASKPGR